MLAVAAIELPLAVADGGPELPKPTGKYSVGTATYYMLDTSRDDERGTQKDHKREFWTQVWYPAKSGSNGKPASWFPEFARVEGCCYADLLARTPVPSPKDADQFLASVVVHAQVGVPVASLPKRFPVILLAPGSISFPSKYTSLAEDLASHGFIVVGDAPVGNGINILFPAGNLTRGYKNEMFSLWAGDLIYELDQLKVWNQTKGNLFHGHVDLNRVGAFGHSAGGLIVARIPAMDKRVKAIALLDPGYVEPKDGEAIPILILKSDHGDLKNDREKARSENEYVQKATPAVQITLLGAAHANFTDLGVIPATAHSRNPSGTPVFPHPDDGVAFMDATRAVLREFFAQSLLGKHSDLLINGSVQYPFMKIEKNPLH